jgi:formylglycine-generating enzyme required for sulfatase activity
MSFSLFALSLHFGKIEVNLHFGAPISGKARPENSPPAETPPARCDVEALVDNMRRCLKQRDSFKDCDTCPEMVVIPPGEFMMGSNDYDGQKPAHTVTLRRPFAVGKFEITFAEWQACVAGGGCDRIPRDEGWGKGLRPVINVSWNDAKQYVSWLSHKTGTTYRLLSEAEWEYSARAGTTSMYSLGNSISKNQAQYSEGSVASAGKTVEVGSFKPNAFGLHDMHGNVWEWVEDAAHNAYHGAPEDGSVWQGGDASNRIIRGGSWFDLPATLRSTFRAGGVPYAGGNFIGFRVARTL